MEHILPTRVGMAGTCFRLTAPDDVLTIAVRTAADEPYREADGHAVILFLYAGAPNSVTGELEDLWLFSGELQNGRAIFTATEAADLVRAHWDKKPPGGYFRLTVVSPAAAARLFEEVLFPLAGDRLPSVLAPDSHRRHPVVVPRYCNSWMGEAIHALEQRLKREAAPDQQRS